MRINKNILIDLAIALAIVLVGIAGYRFSPLLLPKSDLMAMPDAGCDLHLRPCGATLPGGGRVELSISPRPIPMVRPLSLEVRTTGLTARKVEIDFAGINMNMGYNRPTLADAGEGRFAGDASLPVCVTGEMAWQATVMLETDAQRIAIPFRFDSTPH